MTITTKSGDRLKTLCITVLGSGFLRPAPATWGSALASLFFAGLWFAWAAAAGSPWTLAAATLAGVLVASVIAVRWGVWAIARFGNKDPKPFVLDEFAGQWLSLYLLPLASGADARSAVCVIAGQFVLFRIFDVLKPPPARQLERLPAGWGILFDDLFAGVYANIAGQLLWRLTPLAAWLGVHGLIAQGVAG